MKKELELMLEDFLENHKNTEIKNVYLKIYDNYGSKNFQKVFAYFHQELNDSFDFMNKKMKINHHYNADYSRALLELIEELKHLLDISNNTDYKVILEEEYIIWINESKNFLKISGWSQIPEDFYEINIIKYKPIFRFEKYGSKIGYTEKHIITEANFEDNTISIVLKKEVFSHIKKLLNTWNYYNAVEEAYKIVRAKLKLITWKEKAHEWFKENNYEIIFWHKAWNDAEKDFFEWVKFLHMAIQNLRNEKAHTPAQDIDKNLAIHYIVLASLAYDLIDR